MNTLAWLLSHAGKWSGCGGLISRRRARYVYQSAGYYSLLFVIHVDIITI